MFGRNFVSICALALLGFVLSANAMPEPVAMAELENEIDTMSIIDDLVEILKKYLKTAKECIADARENCKDACAQHPIQGVRCVVKYVISQQGKCKIDG